MMIVAMAIAIQQDRRTMAMPAAPRIACTRRIVAANTPAGWNSPVVSRSGATIATGRAATLALRPAGAVAFVVPPAKPAAMGAIVTVVVPRAGRWQVSLDAPVWIDMIRADGKAAGSVAHAHGPVCSGIAKTVAFDLAAGRHDLQLSAATATTVRVMITPA